MNLAAINFSALDPSLLLPPLIAGWLVLATHVPLGRRVLARGIIFLDLAIAQIAVLGVIAAHAFDLAAEGWPTQLAAAAAALAGAALLAVCERRWPEIQEALIGSAFVVAASLGVHYMDMKLQLSGTASGIDANGNPFQGQASTKVSSLPAPLPVIGLRAGWVVAPDWYVDAQAQVFRVKVGAYDGNWSDLRLGATWMFHRNYGVGLGYNRFATKVDVDKNDFNGSLKLDYSGLQAYLTGSF